MHDDELGRDETWDRLLIDLRSGPRVDPAAKARVMDAVRALPIPHPRPAHWWRARSIALSPIQAIAATLVVAAVGGGVATWRTAAPRAPTTEAAPLPPATVVGQTPDSALAFTSVQFVFLSSDAREVSLVGDFNDWHIGATPLRRVSRDGLWSVVVPLAPGRHVYSFVVDGRRWVPDERAPVAPDSEFGGENSIILVGAGSS